MSRENEFFFRWNLIENFKYTTNLRIVRVARSPAKGMDWAEILLAGRIVSHGIRVSGVSTRSPYISSRLTCFTGVETMNTFAHGAGHARACTLVEIIAQTKAGPNACGTACS